MGMILRIASSRIVGQGDIVGRSGYFSLNLSANSVMRGRLDARRTLKSLVADLREDNFFTFWFRFIYKYSYMLEIENYGSVKMIIGRDYETFSGLMLERYFKRVLIERQVYTRIGGWWDRKGENEIDIVAENELDDTATFFEVKRKAENIDMEKLEAKAAAFMRATGEFKGYSLSYKGLSMTDM